MRRAAASAIAALALAAGCASIPEDPFEAGRMAFTRGDLRSAYASFRQAAEAGDARAAKTLGTMLDKGVQVAGGQSLAANPAEAAKWYRQAADAGDAQAANQLAVMYTYGRGVPVDYAQAIRLLGPLAGKKEYDDLPAGDRDELYLWAHSVKIEMYRQLHTLMHNWVHGISVEVIFAGKEPHVTLKTEDSSRAVDAVREIAQRAVAAAPPTPAAVRRNFKFSETIDFR